MKGKAKYKLRREDFIPMIGQEKYLIRNGSNSENFEDAPSEVQTRYKALFVYNFLTFVGLPVGLTKLLQ